MKKSLSRCHHKKHSGKTDFRKYQTEEQNNRDQFKNIYCNNRETTIF